ncbi:hypothetical protein ACHAPD_003728 [Fusarium lateritium]
MMNGLQILPSYIEYFNLNTHLIALNVAIVFAGSVLAMPFAGPISDKYGRKWGMAITSIIAIVGAVIQSAAVQEAMFCIGRLLVGFSVTTGATAAPAYISEVAHPKHRTMLTGLYGTSWYVGSLMAAGITYGSQFIDSTWSWRVPSLLQLIPSICCILPLPFLPESPRWLVYQDRHEEARDILVKYHGDGDTRSPVVLIEYDEICQTLQYEKTVQKTDFAALYKTRSNRWRLGVTAAVACAGAILADPIGRRKSFLGSTTIISFMLIIIAVLTKLYGNSPTTSTSAAQVALIFLFYGTYSFVWTPLATLYPVEVLSYSMRGNGLGFYSGVVYATAFLNTFAIPYAMEWSSWGFYLITAMWNLAFELPIMYFYFPSTERKTLEEIDIIFEGIKHSNIDISVHDVMRRGVLVPGDKITTVEQEERD